jgi:hypothetical protein
VDIGTQRESDSRSTIHGKGALAGKVIARLKGNHAAVTTRRIRAEILSAGVLVAQHAASADVRFSASASRIYETLCAVTSVAIADQAVGHGSRFHSAHVEGGRATTGFRRARLFDSDLLAACGFGAGTDPAPVFGAIKASAPDGTTDPKAGYFTAEGKVTADAEKARATWLEAAANRR